MVLAPKDFFDLIEGSALADAFMVMANEQWCRFAVENVCRGHDPRHREEFIFLTGKLIPATELGPILMDTTIARLGNRDIPCRIIKVSIDVENEKMEDVYGTVRYFPFRQETTVQLDFRYSLYDFNCGDIEQTTTVLSTGVKHMKEMIDNPKEKTFFDWIDLE